MKWFKSWYSFVIKSFAVLIIFFLVHHLNDRTIYFSGALNDKILKSFGKDKILRIFVKDKLLRRFVKNDIDMQK